MVCADALLQSIPYSKRPLYCCSMDGLVICFSGLRSRDEMVLSFTLVFRYYVLNCFSIDCGDVICYCLRK